MDWILSLLPIGLSTLAAQLRRRDANDTGADDAFAQIAADLAPLAPDLISGRPNDNAADRTMLAIYRTAGAYLSSRNKLPNA